MRSVALALLLVLVAVPRLHAQGDPVVPSLEHVLDRLATNAALRGRFNQVRQVPGLSRPLVSSGAFIVSDLGLYWAQTNPFSSILIADQSRVVQVVLDQPAIELSLSDQPVAASIGAVFLGIMTGDRATFEQYFNLEFRADEQGWAIELRPRGQPISSVVETIVVEGVESISSLEITGVSQDRTTVELSDLRSEPEQLTADERALYLR